VVSTIAPGIGLAERADMNRLIMFSILTGCAGLPQDPGTSTPTGGEGPALNGPIAPGKGAFILAHGFGGTADDWDEGIQPAIEAEGHAVLRTSVPATGSVKSRAEALAPQIDAFLADTTATQVHIIAHSMGGLDARYLISTLGYGPKVASLTTISTPHHGTPLADVALGLQQGDRAGALQALVELAGGEEVTQALQDLSEANEAAFNAANPDVTGVTYQSYAGLSTPGGAAIGDASACAIEPDSLRPLLFLPAVVVTGVELRPNDGVVPVDSAMHTGFKGCIAADHLDQPGVFALLTSEFDPPSFYKGIATDLVP
jgi:triacylglycerol lipase